ncbi:hypothetical protein AN1V17_16520 [Vallitalea sediminicola]
MKKYKIEYLQEANSEKWKSIYLITGILIIIMLIIIPVQVIIFAISPHPQTVEGWLELFKNNRLLGLVHFDALYIINNVILAVIYFSLYLSLKKRNSTLITLALILGFIGIASYFSSNKAVEMIFISKEYYLASSDIQRNILLSSAQNMIFEWKGTAYVIYYILNCIALYLISISMLNSSVYSKLIAIFGFISAFFMMIPANFGTIGIVFSLLSLIPWYIFCVLVSKVFFQLSSNNQKS